MLFAVWLLSGASSARADIWDAGKGTYLPFGLTASYLRLHEGDDKVRTGKLGLELSWVEYDSAWWGGYADVAYDFAGERVWMTAGPEFGLFSIGLDAGFVYVLDKGRDDMGFRVRFVVSVFENDGQMHPDRHRVREYFKSSTILLTLGGGALLRNEPQRFLELGALFKLKNER
ncbi:MAG: hypothetical protein QM778_31145 [Myxococcales bacterium]